MQRTPTLAAGPEFHEAVLRLAMAYDRPTPLGRPTTPGRGARANPTPRCGAHKACNSAPTTPKEGSRTDSGLSPPTEARARARAQAASGAEMPLTELEEALLAKLPLIASKLLFLVHALDRNGLGL